MTQDIEAELAAHMRLAFTRATVSFPRKLNMLPISIGVHNVFADVFYELKHAKRWSVRREFEPFEPEMLKRMTVLVDAVREEILCRSVPSQVTRGMPTNEVKRIGSLVAGLDLSSANTLVAYLKSGVGNVVEQRAMMLRNRRNILANKLVKDSIKSARDYFLSEVREHAGSDA